MVAAPSKAGGGVAPRPGGARLAQSGGSVSAAPITQSGRDLRTAADPKRTFAAKYEVKEKLGKGQYADVYRVVNRTNGKILAAKCIRKDKLTPEDLAAFSVEVKAMEMLTAHPNFVAYDDFFSEKDYFYLIMEIITGGELFDRICEKEKYSEREARVLMFQLASGLAYAHKQGIVHRDLKPENILLKSRDDDTSVKLADLGFAKIVGSRMQLMTTPCGTPGYVAPEVISNKPYTLACDVWSLGVIFYILLCGYPPFAADDGDQAELFRQIKTGAYSFSGPEWAVVSDGAKDLVRKMLQVDPAVRLTAAEVLQHPWMEMKSEALPDVSLNASLAALKRLTARRRLKAAMNNVRSIVRMKMMMAARVTLDAKKHGITNADELEKVFVEAAAKPIGITRRASAGNYTLPPGVVVTAPGVVLPTPPPSAVATPAHSRVAAVPGVPQAGV